MTSHFCLSLHFLDRAFHGIGDGGEREWPPSPLRVFQALVAAAARRGTGELGVGVRLALEWMERQPAPVIVAPTSIEGIGYRLSVPNNAMDIVARAWSRGNDSNSGDANPATHRTMKGVRPTLLLGGAVHYLWALPVPIADETRTKVESLWRIAADVVALGWGMDFVVGHGAILSDERAKGFPGERWLPMGDASEGGLRVPVAQTLEDLVQRHRRFLQRIGPDGFVPPPPLSVYRKIEYRRSTDAPSRSVAAFALLDSEANRFVAFDTARRALTVAGMMRHAASTAAARSGWPDDAFILGHSASGKSEEHVAVGPRRFAYLPLPSIEARGEERGRVAASIRRVMLATFAGGCKEEIAWARRTMSGEELIDRQNRPVAILSLIPSDEGVVRCYTQAAAEWATVTPVVLPGYDDPRHYRRRLKSEIGAQEQKDLLGRLENRIDGLLRKAIVQAGFSEELAECAQIDWRKSGFWPGTDLADQYGVPDHLKRFPRLHVSIRWRNADGDMVRIPGPICLGGGRFYGLGLFAAV